MSGNTSTGEFWNVMNHHMWTSHSILTELCTKIRIVLTEIIIESSEIRKYGRTSHWSSSPFYFKWENEHYTFWVQLSMWKSFIFTWVYFLRRGVKRRNLEGSAPVLDWLSTAASWHFMSSMGLVLPRAVFQGIGWSRHLYSHLTNSHHSSALWGFQRIHGL